MYENLPRLHLTDEAPNPLPRSKNGNKTDNFGDLSIKLSIHYDLYLFRLHKMNRTSIETFINRTISSTSLTFKHSEIQKVAKISFWVQRIQLFNESEHKITNTHWAKQYLNSFCSKVVKFNGSDVIYALFTG